MKSVIASAVALVAISQPLFAAENITSLSVIPVCAPWSRPAAVGPEL